MLKIENLKVYVEDKLILKNINLEVNEKEIVAIMGPNGSGKTSLARAILNHKGFRKEGKIYFNGEDITNLETYEISKRGIYYTFQSPPEIETIKNRIFLMNLLEKYDENHIRKIANELGLPEDFLNRGINEGFSGGEKKKFELFLMKLLNPKLVIFDEIDSGLDVDSLLFVEKEIMNRDRTYIIITHYTRIFRNIKPDKVYILLDGEIKKVGGEEVLDHIERYGYRNF